MSQAQLTSLSRQLAEWAGSASNQQFFRTNQERLLASAIDDPARRPQLQVAAWLLGTWHLGHGLATAWQGDSRGFDEARTGQALRRCSLLLRNQQQQPGRGAAARMPFSLLQGTLTALLGLALADPGAEPLYEILRQLPDQAFAANDHLAAFTRELLTMRAGQRPVITPRLGAYEAILLQWQGEARLLAQHLAAVLDLHLQQLQGRDGAFADPPCRAYPLEVLAIRNVRDWLSLPTPKVEHPLMFTNLVTMPMPRAWPQDDRVLRLERLLRQR